MKREILFRAKRSNTGEWVYGDLTHTETLIKGEIVPCIRVAGYDVDEDTIGQYTELRDKDSFEIYDGDIVRDDTCHNRDNLFRVKWDAFNDYCWLLVNKKTARRFLRKHHSRYTIVGNIHDNPKLLEEEQQ